MKKSTFPKVIAVPVGIAFVSMGIILCSLISMINSTFSIIGAPAADQTVVFAAPDGTITSVLGGSYKIDAGNIFAFIGETDTEKSEISKQKLGLGQNGSFTLNTDGVDYYFSYEAQENSNCVFSVSKLSDIQAEVYDIAGYGVVMIASVFLCMALIIFLIVRREIEIEKILANPETARIAKSDADALTGILNRGALTAQINNYFSHSVNYLRHAFFIVDVDNFKKVNDTFGHREGDKTLKKVAATLTSLFRNSDVVGRLGGDEFVVLMKNCKSGNHVRRKAKEMCEALQFVSFDEHTQVQTSVSIGITMTTGSTKPFEQLYQEADKALYHSKQHGKNRFEFSDGSTSDTDGEDIPSANVQLNALLKYMDSGVVLIEMADAPRVLYISPAYYRLMGISEDMLGSSLTKAVNFIDGSKTEFLMESMKACADTDAALDTEYKVILPDGKKFWHRMKAVRIPYEDSSFPVLIAVIDDITRSKKDRLRIQENDEFIRLALQLTDTHMMTVDICEKTAALWDAPNNCFSDKNTLNNLPESLIADKTIHPDSAAAARKLFLSLQNGVPEGKCPLVLKNQAGDYSWTKIAYRGVFDDDGKMKKAVVILETLPNIVDAKARFEQEEKLRRAVCGDSMMTAKVNLTENKVESYDKPGYVPVFGRADYDAMICAFDELIVSEEDKKNFREKFSASSVIRTYENGGDSVMCEFRMKTGENTTGWVSYSLKILAEPFDGTVYGFCYLKDIDERVKRENEANCFINHDAVSFIYNRKTTEQLISHILSKSSERSGKCAMALIDLSGLIKLSERMGMGYANNVVFSISRLFRMLLDSKHIIGRVDYDIIALFFTEAESEEQIRNTVDEFLRSAESIYPFGSGKGKDDITCLYGMEIRPAATATYGMLVFKALDKLDEQLDIRHEDLLESARENNNG